MISYIAALLLIVAPCAQAARPGPITLDPHARGLRAEGQPYQPGTGGKPQQAGFMQTVGNPLNKAMMFATGTHPPNADGSPYTPLDYAMKVGGAAMNPFGGRRLHQSFMQQVGNPLDKAMKFATGTHPPNADGSPYTPLDYAMKLTGAAMNPFGGGKPEKPVQPVVQQPAFQEQGQVQPQSQGVPQFQAASKGPEYQG